MTAEQAKAVQYEAARQQGLAVTFTNAVGMKVVYIPPGTFMMGSQLSTRFC